MKSLICSILVVFLSLTLCSCSDEARFGLSKKDLTKDLRSKIEVITCNNDDGVYQIEKIIYQGEEYFPCKEIEYFATYLHNNSENKILLSWNGSRIFRYAYTSFYFSDTEKDPFYIYSVATQSYWHTYFKKDYNYKTDTFFIEGTDCEALFSDFCNPSGYLRIPPKEATDIKKVTLKSKTNPKIGFIVEFFEVDNEWYSLTGESADVNPHNNVTLLSNELVQKLKTHNIIA